MHRPSLILIALIAGPVAVAAADEPPKQILYAPIHAIFTAHCAGCHSAKEAEGGLVLTSHAALLEGADSGEVIVPGNAAGSVLVKVIEHEEKPFMPPPKKAEKLGPEQIALIRAWLDAGALPPKPGELEHAGPKIPHIEPKVTPRRAVHALAFEAKSKLLAIGRVGEVELRSTEHRGLVRKLSGHHGNVNDQAFSADGTILATAGGEAGQRGQVRIWNVADGKLMRTMEGHSDAIYAVAISPDRKLMATGSYDQTIILWQIETGQPQLTIKGHNGAVFDLAFRQDGKVLASASADRTIKLWETPGGNRLDTLTESLKQLHSLAFSPDGKFLTGGGVDRRIRLWQIGPEAKEGTNTLLVSRMAHEGAILKLAYTDDGKSLLSSGDDRTVKLWDAAEITSKLVLEAQPDWPAALAFGPTSKTGIVGRLDGSVEFYDLETGKAMPPPKPKAAWMSPRALQRGRTVKLKLSGENLVQLESLQLHHPKLNGRILADDQQRAEVAYLEVTAAADLPRGAYELSVGNAGGESERIKLHVGDLIQVDETEPNNDPAQADTAVLPASFWGVLGEHGDVDHFAFDAKVGQAIVLDLASSRLEAKGDFVLELADQVGRVLAVSNDFDGQSDPLLSYVIPADGRYVVTVRDLTYGWSKDHFYRLSAGQLPLVTACYPLSVPPESTTAIELIGPNLEPNTRLDFQAPASGEATLPIDPQRFRTRRELTVLVGEGPEQLEAEPNDTPATAQPLMTRVINGRIDSVQSEGESEGEAGSDVDFYRFEAKAGEKWIIETDAAQRGSPVDTKVAVLHEDGRPVQRLRLRAVRDSYIVFRAIDANYNGVRLPNWEEMQLNEYLYLKGEVARLFLAPRGPDSQWNFFVSAGKRRCYFDTSAVAHAIEETCYIVEPHPPDSQLPENGLPVFELDYVNDDDALRKLGADSRLHFTAPADSTYLIRVSDVRDFGGKRFAYRLLLRRPAPEVKLSIEGQNQTIPPGTGRRFTINANRIDEFNGPVQVEIEGAPPGFTITSPLLIEAGHNQATGTIYASANAPAPTPENASASQVTATFEIDTTKVSRLIGDLGKIGLGDEPKLSVWLLPDHDGQTTAHPPAGQAAELTIAPGQMIPAWLKVERYGYDGNLQFDVENLPHGVIVTDIGLNGVMILEGESQRRIFLSCASWVADTSRFCHARPRGAGNPTSPPVLLHVRRSTRQAKSP